MFGYQEAPKGGAVRWLCNPNNPTGEVYPLEKIQILSRRHHWLVIDQSYEDCTSCEMLSPREGVEMQNVIQIHSMTKRFSIPGLRLGYITAPAPVISRLRTNYRPWAVNALAIEAGRLSSSPGNCVASLAYMSIPPRRTLCFVLSGSLLR